SLLFPNPVHFGGPVSFRDLPPIVRRTRTNVDTISATSAAEFNITVAEPVAIAVTAPTWYRLVLKGWFGGAGGSELRAGIALTGATVEAYNAPTWGNTIRGTSHGNVLVEKLVLLNPGTTNIRVMGYTTTPGSLPS